MYIMLSYIFRKAIPTTMSLLTVGIAQATAISSTFDATTEGWLSTMLAYPHPGEPPVILGTFSPNWTSAGGNPGGNISLADPDGSNATGNSQYWHAPSYFLGNRQAWYGGLLTFDLQNSGSGFGLFSQEDVILTSGGITLVRDLLSAPSQVNWSHFSVGMTQAGWRKGSYSGNVASQGDMIAVLSSLDAIYIRGEYQYGPDVARLDSVSFTSARVSGVAVLGGYTASVAGGPLNIQVWQNGNLVESLNGNYSDGNKFAFSPVSNGQVVLKFQFRAGLWKSVAVSLGVNAITDLMVSMTNGDCNNDNVIDLTDYTILVSAFNALPSSTNWDVRADLNGDNTVDLTDYTILVTNFNSVGD